MRLPVTDDRGSIPVVLLTSIIVAGLIVAHEKCIADGKALRDDDDVPVDVDRILGSGWRRRRGDLRREADGGR